MSSERNEMNAGRGSQEEIAEKFLDAADLAGDQDKITYVTDDSGKPYAAIVPLEVAEHHERWIAAVLSTPVAPPVTEKSFSSDPVRRPFRGGGCNFCGHGAEAHRIPKNSPCDQWPLEVLECIMCNSGECLAPAARTRRDRNALVARAISGKRT